MSDTIEVMSETIEVLCKTDQFIAVNKPAGIATQAPAPFESVESRLRIQLERQSSYLAFPHRLDRWVSGVLLAALTKRAARLLSGQFESRKTSKTYLASVEGHFEGQHRWEDWLRKIAGQARVEVCDEKASDAKAATTVARGIEIHPSLQRSTIELSPITGRMHQLRVQAASRGFPIVGDTLYGATPIDSERILLHASQLEFHDPADGKRTVVRAPAPFG